MSNDKNVSDRVASRGTVGLTAGAARQIEYAVADVGVPVAAESRARFKESWTAIAPVSDFLRLLSHTVELTLTERRRVAHERSPVYGGASHACGQRTETVEKL